MKGSKVQGKRSLGLLVVLVGVGLALPVAADPPKRTRTATSIKQKKNVRRTSGDLLNRKARVPRTNKDSTKLRKDKETVAEKRARWASVAVKNMEFYLIAVDGRKIVDQIGSFSASKCTLHLRSDDGTSKSIPLTKVDFVPPAFFRCRDGKNCIRVSRDGRTSYQSSAGALYKNKAEADALQNLVRSCQNRHHQIQMRSGSR